MSLEKKDIEIIERLVYKNSDDIAVSIARSFERLEERIDAVESRIFGRAGELQDQIESIHQDLSDELSIVKQAIRYNSDTQEMD